MIVGKELFGAHTVSAPIGAIHRDRHTGQFRDHMANGLGVTFKTACLSLGSGSASSPPYTYI
jgi:lysozyme family protein